MWRHFGGGSDKHVRQDGAHDLGGTAFVDRIHIGKQESDKDRFDTCDPEVTRGHCDGVFVQRGKFGTRRIQPALDRHAMTAFDQRSALPRQILHDRIMLRPLMPPDVQNIAKSVVGDHPGRRAGMNQHRIGADCRTVKHTVDLPGFDPGQFTDAPNPRHHAQARVGGRGGRLVDGDLPMRKISKNQIGKRPANIDAKSNHSHLPSCN